MEASHSNTPPVEVTRGIGVIGSYKTIHDLYNEHHADVHPLARTTLKMIK
jgi:hypothetical protein